jgi:hypothetical protein
MSKKDEPGKGPAASGAPGASRPHATLDLKAKDVTPASETADKAAGKKEADPVAGKSADAKVSAAAASAAGASGTGASATAAPFSGPQNAGAGTSAKSDKSAAGAPSPDKNALPPRRTGSGGFFTHLAAGVAGGILALIAADTLAPQLGLGQRDSATKAMEQRIAALEQTRDQGAPTLATDQRLKAAEDKLEKLAALSPKVDNIAKRQDAIAGDIKAVDVRAGKGASPELAARVAKLEDQLTTLSAAAQQDPQSDRLPQLAAVTGKVSDLEATMAHQLDALRKSVNDEIDTRLMVASETSEAAKAGTQRLDREVAGIKTENAQLASDLGALKAESDRTSTMVKTTADSLSSLRSEIDARLANVAKPNDVAAAIGPLSDKVSTLQKNVSDVVQSEDTRKTTAQRIVLSLELTDLKRAIDRGTAYAAELAHIRDLAGSSLNLAPLDRFAERGAPTLPELQRDFKSIAFKIIDAGQTPTDGSIVDRLLAGAKSVVRVRKINHSPDDKSTEAIVGRMETALNADDLDTVLKEAKSLPEAAQKQAQDFLAKVEARNAVDRALKSVEAQLKTALVSPAGAPAGTPN